MSMMGRRCLTLSIFLSISTTGFAKTVFRGDFEPIDWLKTFNIFVQPPWTENLKHTSRIFDPDKKKYVLQVVYPANKFGNDQSGAQWPTYLDKSYERLIVSYDVKFSQNFQFVKGGKLPGLIGGHREGHPHSNLTGGHRPNGKDGWSGRIMWRRDGNIVQYVYHPDQPDKWGQDFPWMINGKPARFTPGKWHNLKTEIVMNTPGQKNGIIRSWLDGEKALEITTLRFRDIPTIGIDALYFSTFYGGDDKTWCPTSETKSYFDNFAIID